MSRIQYLVSSRKKKLKRDKEWKRNTPRHVQNTGTPAKSHNSQTNFELRVQTFYRVVRFISYKRAMILVIRPQPPTEALTDYASLIFGGTHCIVFQKSTSQAFSHRLCTSQLKPRPPNPPGHSREVTGTWPWKCAFATLHFPRGTETVMSCQICGDFSPGL